MDPPIAFFICSHLYGIERRRVLGLLSCSSQVGDGPLVLFVHNHLEFYNPGENIPCPSQPVEIWLLT